MKIAIGGDHAGYLYKKQLITKLEEQGYSVDDFGPFSSESCDYPDMIHPLAKSIDNKVHDIGIIMCGSGNGISITANKHQGVRCALAWNVEVASLARSHNDANILALPARFISYREAVQIVDAFISTPFEAGRHLNRVNKISIA
ncbi:ribose 5-phosphate isomerase B [Veronia nyctiphanis]|uniref:Ribose 5-phosphate isomerase B n=1 Tax=Veronia nyctiphanis TaxID=1278244 RepID=A0A4Q0YUN3_9GAMM|nr:ribose 5-phosphate isomerase B [Veronia nyctiphanis]RXJ72741.1 ribose 5-phosphate isomerase B [Veronia nyctiphanis]